MLFLLANYSHIWSVLKQNNSQIIYGTISETGKDKHEMKLWMRGHLGWQFNFFSTSKIGTVDMELS